MIFFSGNELLLIILIKDYKVKLAFVQHQKPAEVYGAPCLQEIINLFKTYSQSGLKKVVL